jgi:type II secretory pathway pseudopilin PulG
MELLALLARDAPAAEISAAGADASARDAALKIRATIDGHRRRESDLAALVDIARDLASLADPGGVLDTIVRRARSLLGTDVAYLTLADPGRGDTFMRATAGSVSARFQALRLPIGAGLGGLVAQTRRPYWTADYPGDERYRHTSEIDSAVGEEGLVAICGTPLLVEGAFVGVLFAADRSRRPFTPGEVALLGSLAALAAVSIVQTRRAAETAAALEALSVAHAGIEQAAEAHDRFAAVVLGGGGVEDVVATLGELMGGWVAAVDADGERLATCGDAPATLPDVPAAGRLAQAGGAWAVAVTAAGQRLGTLLLGGLGDLDAGRRRIVERAAVVCALVLVFRLRAAEAQQRVGGDLLAELLARDTADTGLAERARLLGLRPERPHVVLVCRGDRAHGLLVASATAGDGRGLSVKQGGEIVALVPGADPSGVATALAARFAGAVTVGAAGPTVPARGPATAYAEARRTAGALVALGRSGEGAAASDLGFAGLVAGDTPDVAGWVERVLGPVTAHDAARGTDLTATLRAYFAAGASPRRASQALHVHVNTVVQRLDRVAALLGPDWSSPERALEIQLALRLAPLVRG